LSFIYGIATGGRSSAIIPGFLASFSHFIGDMLVHNQDLVLDPFSNIMIGGTNMWGNFPTFAFYFEMAFCLVCATQSHKDSHTLLANGLILFLHFSGRSGTSDLLQKVFRLPEALQQKYTAVIITSSFIVPGLILGYILNRKKSLIEPSKRK
jgi:hypothetical protein